MIKKLLLLLTITTLLIGITGIATAIPQNWNLQCPGHEGHIFLHGDNSADATLDGRSYSFSWSLDNQTGDGQAQWMFWSEKFHYDGNVITSDFISGCALVPNTTTQVEPQQQTSFFGIFGFSA
jgi:hypothetical protein